MTTSNDTTWKDIPGYEGLYQASTNGNIRRIYSKRGLRAGGVLVGGVSNNGYVRMVLMRDGERKTWSVHRVVMLTFIGVCPIGKVVNHIDGVKTNNVLSNLEYVTPKENVRHSIEVTGNRKPPACGEASTSARLTERDVREIRDLAASGLFTQRVIAEMYGVIKVNKVISRATWKHVR